MHFWFVANWFKIWPSGHVTCIAWFQSWSPGCVTRVATLPHCLGMPYWHHQLVLSLYLHQLESHQLSLHKRLSLSLWERTGPIDRTPGTPGSDKNVTDHIRLVDSVLVDTILNYLIVSNFFFFWVAEERSKLNASNGSANNQMGLEI